MTSTRRARRGEHGQVMVITALLATILIGAAALAVDLSVQTGNRRTLQNVADVAALAGARDLYSTSTSSINPTDQGNAVADALVAAGRDMSWPDTWVSSDTSAMIDNCAGFPPATFTTFGLSGHCEKVHYGNYTVTVSTPPMSPRNSADMDPHDVQVDVSQSAQNGFAGVIGFGSSQTGGHAVAGHMPAGVPIDFALFSNSVVQAGNQGEIVTGNVYANRAVQPQSNGVATFCAQQSNSSDGYIILGTPQTAASGGQPSVNQARTITTTTSCSAPTVSGAYQTATSMQNGTHSCPSITGMPDVHLSYDSTVGACVTLPLVPPSAAPPPVVTTTISTPCQGAPKKNPTSCWDGTTTHLPGVYVVNHNSGCVPTSCWDLLLSASQNLTNVTFWLKPNATLGIQMSGSSGAVTDSGPFNAGTGQAGDGKYVVYGEAGSQLEVAGNNTSITFSAGSIYMPGGSVVGTSSSAQLFVSSGQAITDTWNISTGNQTNPAITHNAAYDAVSQETLRLLE